MTPEQRLAHKVPMQLEGEDGNAFAILGRFKDAARRTGWPNEDAMAVVTECMSSDYDGLLQTMLKYTTPEPRFSETHCSQCGREFGPGECGWSHCEDHR